MEWLRPTQRRRHRKPDATLEKARCDGWGSPPIINHDAPRALFGRLGAFQRAGPLPSLPTMAVGAVSGESKGETMVARLGAVVQDMLVSSSLGNNYTPKYVDGEPMVGTHHRLRSRSFGVERMCSMCCRAGRGECERPEPVLLAPAHPGSRTDVAEVLAPMAPQLSLSPK
jgi:hypothetical protein